MKPNLKKTDSLDTINEIGVSSFIDLIAFLNITADDIPRASLPNKIDVAQEIENSKLTDEDYVSQFIDKYTNEDIQLQLAGYTADFERLLQIHQFGVNSLSYLTNEDQIEFITNVEMPTIKDHMDSLVTHWGQNYKDKDSLHRQAQRYYWFLQNKLDAYQQSQIQRKPERSKRKNGLTEKLSNSNLWDHCFIKEKDLSYSDQFYEEVVKYIRTQVELDRGTWEEHKIFYMCLWIELREKGYLSEESKRLPKTKAIILLRNTFPDQTLNDHICKQRSLNKTVAYKNPIKGKIPGYVEIKTYYQAFFNFTSKDIGNPIKFDPPKFDLRNIKSQKRN